MQITDIKNKLGANFLYIVGLLPILLIGIYVRTRNLRFLKGKYLLGLDPYAFYRYASIIVEKGSLMAVDTMRYVPLGYKLSPSDIFFSHTLALGYKLTRWLGISQMEFHILYPVIAGIIGFVFLFLFLREMFGNKVALVATAFAAVLPAYIYRTGAGFADHEAMAMMWMFASLYLFAKAWNSEKLGRWLSFSIGSGILAGFMVLTWGGYKFLFAGIGILIPLVLIFSKTEKEIMIRRLYAFFVWLVVGAVFLYIRYGSFGFVRAPEFVLASFAALAGIAYICIHKYKEKIPEQITAAMPIGFLSTITAGVASIIGATLIGFSIPTLISRVFYPAQSSRLGNTISENAIPYFKTSWLSIGNFGITSWLILGSAVLLFWFIFRGKNKYAAALTAGWAVTIAAIILGSYDAGSTVSKFFTSTYVYILLAFIVALLAVYLYTYNKDKKIFDSLFDAQWQPLLIFAMFMFTLVMAKRSIRVMFALAPIAAIVVGYSLVKSIKWLCKDRDYKVGLAILLGLFALFCLISNVNASLEVNNSMGSGYPGQWESAMGWIRESTSSDAVFMHWWDYGYWTQAMGERASVVDGGNAMAWDHGAGRYGLLGRDETKYLPYLKTHEVSHLLISAEEIGKFHAYATIGSDENWDLYSSIGTYSVSQSEETRDGYGLAYSGYWALDKDYTIGNKVWEKGKDTIAGFTLEVTNDGQIGNPTIVLYDGTNQVQEPLNCVCTQGQCYDFGTNGFGGCMVLAPQFISQTEANPIGAAFYASEKIINTNFVRMYIIGEENPHFKEVYTDGNTLGTYQGRVIGPIKIWEVQYPDWVVADAKYLERSIYG